MKTIIVLLLLMNLTFPNGWGQISVNHINSRNTIQSKLEVKQLLLSKWNTEYGIPYSKVPGANLGATSFELLDSTRVAFLCNSTNEIIIIDASKEKATKKIPVTISPRDFIYDNGLFFVLGENQVVIYDLKGREKNQFTFPNNYLGTERLARFNNETYLLLPSGNSLKIESDGMVVSPQEYEGWITTTGDFIKTQINGENTFLVKVILTNGIKYEKTLTVDKKVAGVYMVGTTKDRIVLDIQTFISESPIRVERIIASIVFNKAGIYNIIAEIKIPDVYFVLSNKDLTLSSNGKLCSMISAPDGVLIYSLSETMFSEKSIQTFPESLDDKTYHFNDHLIKIEEK